MSGKPAARQGDETLDGGPIVQGSQTVLIGSQGGIACSVCPGGVKKGSPVNPQLGAKVLLGAEDLDFALPGALPVVWQRQYSSYVNAEHGAACGLLGHGWHLLTEIALELKARALLLFDSAGRVITFEESLPPGGQQYSASEDLWLLRGGKDPQGYPAFWSRQPRFTHVGAELAANEQCIIATNGAAETLWVFTPDPERESRWRLSAQTDRFGRSQSYQYSTSEKQRKPRKGEDPLPAGRLVAITDGAGRRYRLQQQRIHPGKQAQGPWAADTGWRLIAVQLEHDPHHATPEPITLVRYGYDRAGQLITVHDRAGQLVREFEWSRHRISAHRHQAGPWHRYQYAGQEPELKVIAQTNEQGLDYKFQYISQQPSAEGKPRSLAIVTDSIGRVETYRFEGAAGLSRLIEHQRADGGVMRNRFDGYGRQVAKTDPLGRTTWIRRDAQGNITGLQEPGGIRSSHSYDESGRITESQDADGAVTKYQYDPYLRLSRITLADQSTHHYRYPDPKEHPHACDSPSEIQDAKGGLKRLAYNSAGQLASYTDCSGQSTRYRHDRWGEVIEIRDALGQYTVHERDAQGRIAATRLPNGQTSRYQYNARGQLTRIQPDENTPGSVLEMQHDLWGRLIQSTQGGLTLQFKYDKAGRLSTLINENQAQSRFAWDVMDRLTQEEGFDERLQRYEWDVAGQLKASHDGNAVQMQAGQAQSSHYQWDEAGRLQEIRTSATQNQPGQVRRYKWDRAGRMKAADVYQIEGEQEHLQTRVEFERDTLKRLTREIQRIYKPSSAPGVQPKVEYEHQITHQFDELGNRTQSELQNFGQIQWLLYGSGHVHGLLHDSQNLIDFERDALHRETKRLLHGQDEQDLQINRWRDSLGRLQNIRLEQLPQAQHPAPQTLIGQITERRYHYDALGQIVAIQTPSYSLRYGYDQAGRLRAMADSLDPQNPTRWEIDPAGNRLPTPAANGEPQQPDWAEQVHRSWRQQEFNLLGPSHGQITQGAVTKWVTNRIGFHQGSVWRYDPCGNRVEQVSQQANQSYQRQKLSYDGSHQLSRLDVEGIDLQGNITQLSQSSYVHDALGRRLKKTVKDKEGKEHISYFGWDGDRLVRTERLNEDGTRQIEHIVHEPGTFTPLVRLSTTAQGGPQVKPNFLVQATQAAMPADKRNSADTLAALEMMQGML